MSLNWQSLGCRHCGIGKENIISLGAREIKFLIFSLTKKWQKLQIIPFSEENISNSLEVQKLLLSANDEKSIKNTH